jgi:hypothetical protein
MTTPAPLDERNAGALAARPRALLTPARVPPPAQHAAPSGARAAALPAGNADEREVHLGTLHAHRCAHGLPPAQRFFALT